MDDAVPPALFARRTRAEETRRDAGKSGDTRGLVQARLHHPLVHVALHPFALVRGNEPPALEVVEGTTKRLGHELHSLRVGELSFCREGRRGHHRATRRSCPIGSRCRDILGHCGQSSGVSRRCAGVGGGRTRTRQDRRSGCHTWRGSWPRCHRGPGKGARDWRSCRTDERQRFPRCTHGCHHRLPRGGVRVGQGRRDREPGGNGQRHRDQERIARADGIRTPGRPQEVQGVSRAAFATPPQPSLGHGPKAECQRGGPGCIFRPGPSPARPPISPSPSDVQARNPDGR